MVVGSYVAVTEVRTGEESNSSLFDKIAFLYIYLEPTVSGTIILLAFTYHRRYLLKSFKIVHRTTKSLEEQGSRISMLYVKIQTALFLVVFIVGNIIWNFHSYLNKKSTLHSFYEYLGWGISFHIQQVLLFYFVVHMELSQLTVSLLNQTLQKIDDQDVMAKLTKIGAMHSELCKAVTCMDKLCSPVILLFSIRSYFVLCCSVLSLNGMLPKLKGDFLILACIYVGTTVQFVFRSESFHRTVSKDWITIS